MTENDDLHNRVHILKLKLERAACNQHMDDRATALSRAMAKDLEEAINGNPRPQGLRILSRLGLEEEDIQI